MNYPDFIDFDESSTIETAAIGAMLLSTAALEYGLEKLRPKMLRSVWNRRVLLGMKRLQTKANVDNRFGCITFVEIAIELRDMGWPTDQSFAYCRNCCDYCPCPDNFKFYIDDVVATANKHALCSVAEWLRLGEWAAFHARKPETDDRRVAATLENCLALIRRDGWCDPEKVWERTK